MDVNVQQSNSSACQIGDWLVEPENNALVPAANSHTREGAVSIEPKMMDVLFYLCEHAGQVVSAEQLLIACWKGTFYGDSPVQKCIAMLRKKLGCNARQPTYIETVQKRGYRIIADVSFAPGTGRYEPHIPKSWHQGSPYLGLNAFQIEHAPVYFGRTKAIADVIQRMGQASKASSHFVLLLGKSGIGKSSLIRAGVLPFVTAERGFGGCKVSSYHILSPREAHSGSPFNLLIDSIIALDILPASYADSTLQLSSSDYEGKLLQALQRHNKPVAGDDGAQDMKLLIIDQFEQYLLNEQFSDSDKAKLVFTLTTLASQQNVMVVTLLRNDFYAQCIEVAGFAALKDEGVQYDLPPPVTSDIAKMIRNPALTAGLHFETNAEGEHLDDLLLEEAVSAPDALPLLEYTLAELYQQRDNEQLTFAAYQAMGGVRGAMAKQAEQTFQALAPASQQCWHKIMHTLVRIDTENANAITARKVPISQFSAPEEKAFINAFVSARLFVAERSDHDDATDTGKEYVGVAHEALLKHWDRVNQWVAENREALHRRYQLTQDCNRWVEEGKAKEFVLTSAKKLGEAKALQARNDMTLSEAECDFIAASARYHAGVKARKKLGFVVAGVVFVLVSVLGLLAMRQSYIATEARNRAENLIDFMLGDLREQLDPIGKLDVLEGVGEATLAYYQDNDNQGKKQQANSLKLLAEINISKDKMSEATAQLEQAKAILLQLPDSAHDEEYYFLLGNIEYWLGLVFYYDKDYANVEPHWQAYLEHSEAMLSLDDKSKRALVEVSSANHNLAVLETLKETPEKVNLYLEKTIEITNILLSLEPENLEYAISYVKTLDWLALNKFKYHNVKEARDTAAKGLEFLKHYIIEKPYDFVLLNQFINELNWSANTYVFVGDFEGAMILQKEHQNSVHALFKQDAKNVKWQWRIAKYHIRNVELATLMGKRKEQVRFLDELLSKYFELIKSGELDKRTNNWFWRITLPLFDKNKRTIHIKKIVTQIQHNSFTFDETETPWLVATLFSLYPQESDMLIGYLTGKVPPLKNSQNDSLYTIMGHYFLAQMRNQPLLQTELATRMIARGVSPRYIESMNVINQQ